MLSLFKIRTLVLHWVGVAFAAMMIFGFLAWFPALLMRGYGINVAEAGKIMGLTAIVGIIATPIGGLLSDMWQKRSRRGRMLFISLLFLLFAISKCFLLLSIGTSLKLTVLLAVIDGFISPMTGVLVYTINADVTPRRLRATSAGMQVLFTFLCGGAWGPVIIGALSDSMGGGAAGLVNAGFILTIAGVLSCIAFFIASSSYPNDSERVSDEVFADER
jgi:MFS family permease